MINLNPSMRLKVKRDTFFLPDQNRGVYFRNNVSSFRMEGSTIIQWVEKLLPMFNGKHTLKELTDGLPGSYRDRVFEIAEVLYRNGFVRDVNQDRPHQLSKQVLDKYASQIEFLESFGDSGAYRFQSYRQEKALAVGSGPFFVSLVSALIESGLSKFHIIITDSVPTNRQRLREIVTHARKTDLEVTVEEIHMDIECESSWREIVQPFDSILYVSQEGDLEELRKIHAICLQENKLFLPAICLGHVGLVGPLVNSESKGCWENAWSRLHRTVLNEDCQSSSFSSTAGAMLANVIAFELFKETAGMNEWKQNNKFYLLNMETLAGSWHPFMPHPLVNGNIAAKWVDDFVIRLKQKSMESEPGKWFLSFSILTSDQSGIFHRWDEGDLHQLPLAQCFVQVVDPLSEGPAELLPEIICSDLTHEEARREAGLTGIEVYVSHTVRQLITTLPSHKECSIQPEEFVGVGIGETFAEGVCRGLQKCLDEVLRNQECSVNNHVAQVKLEAVEDERCQYYLKALTTMQGPPSLRLGKEVFGFPVVWVGISDKWYGCVGLNMTMALRHALQNAIMKAQNKKDYSLLRGLEVEANFQDVKIQRRLIIPALDETTHSDLLQTAMQILKQNHKRLAALELELEPVFKEELAGVFGVLLREEEPR
ncbi:putative thiazole-containing bacteriocin maturation protein [Bacillus sp. JJ722]|uniref:putative thiazole-containing bacteriocin maturation protein n=1 Tax=Bacillus sp. JJ722 TaxID=3122973 RepID=UPI003000D306